MTELDASTLDEIAWLMCGDDRPLRRKGWELQEFLRRAGISVPDYDGSYRRQWTRRALEGDSDGVPNAERAILRLADRREYATEKTAYQETLQKLGEILSLENLELTQDRRGRPGLAETCEPAQAAEALLRAELKVPITQVIADEALAAAVEQRLGEARLCEQAGAYVAAIIMLGSLLEGVLIATVSERLPGELDRRRNHIGLQELIILAHKEQWIQVDARLGSDMIRQYRNYVHAAAQARMGHLPDADTLKMCWPVVNATLNDLAETGSLGTNRQEKATRAEA